MMKRWEMMSCTISLGRCGVRRSRLLTRKELPSGDRVATVLLRSDTIVLEKKVPLLITLVDCRCVRSQYE